MAMVMGPTPPGTGLMPDATALQDSKWQSPTKRYPAFLDGSSTGLVPTSITTAPGFSQSPRIISGRPAAAITMSALRTVDARSAVREWAIVTVASRLLRSMAAGMPTMLDRPTTTAFFPRMSTPQRSSSTMQPRGVQGTNSGSRPFIASLPMLSGWKPSTSLSMLISASTAASSMWPGGGSWTRMPCTAGSEFSSRTFASKSSWVTLSGSSALTEWMPTSSQALCFIRTYVWESLRSPTITTASPVPVRSFIAATSAAIS